MPTSPALKNAMRIRRHQPSRLESFVDASFAFAITLVVIAVGHIPSSVPEMLRALHGLPTFAVCFLLLARIWLAHRNWSRYYDLEDTPTVTLSLALVFVVLVFVYPMRVLFAQALLGWSGNWLSDGSVAPLDTIDELRAAYTVFGCGFAAVAAIFVLLHAHALRCAERIGLDAGERIYTRMGMYDWIGHVAVCLLSIALARWLPMRNVFEFSLPGFVYVLTALTAWISGSRSRIAFARLSPSDL
ncbi:MAG: DUF1211 domain-containing protein [Rudaea sp.]|nr:MULTISPECIES: TMEM175 family protein [unclassified Rudaea]MBN8887055.1 DUF1211 domain-containing protein [Rudaea sp.]MBR0347584.1 DUF1211 domain-containing protein [Rudaea sp.]